MEEIWKDIPGFKGYQVSDLGRVKSLNYHMTGNEKILKIKANKQDYLCVTIYKDGKRKDCFVHRLVAQAFVFNDDPEHKTQVNHINESVIDNRACNLNWMSPKENINWGTGIKRCHQKQINHPNESKPVKQLSLDGTLITIWPSTHEAQRNGFNQSVICQCCKGRLKTHKGFRWEYV